MSASPRTIPKPRQVRFALRLAWATLLALTLATLFSEVAATIDDLSASGADSRTFGAKARVFLLAAPLVFLSPKMLFVWTSALIFFALGRGVAWVRWLFLIGVVVSGIGQVVAILGASNPQWSNPLRILASASYLTSGAAIGMLFGSEASSWFNAVRDRSSR
jgi:hypothetical protein